MLLNKKMDKQIVVYSYDGTLLDNFKKESFTDTSKNKEEHKKNSVLS